jgi:hypothetical protein
MTRFRLAPSRLKPIESAAVHALFRQPRRKLGPPLQKVIDAGGLGRRARHVADEMDDDVAALDISFQKGERVAAHRLEVFLDLDLDIGSRQRAAQFVAIVAELVRHAGKERLHVRHSTPPRVMAIGSMWHGGAGRAKGARRLWRLMGFACVPANSG